MSGRELGISNKGWPGLKGCKLISKSHPRHAQASSQICCRNNQRLFQPLHQHSRHTADETDPRGFPSSAHSALDMSSRDLRQPGAH